MKSVFRIFFGAKDSNPFFVLTCLVIAGLAGAISLMTFLPVVTELAGGISGTSSDINRYVAEFITGLGLTPSIGVMLALAFTAVCLKSIMSFFALGYVGHVAATISANLRLQLLTNIMAARWRYFTEQPSGRIANAVSDESTRAGAAYLLSGRFFAIVVETMIYTAAALMVSWRLTVVGLTCGGLIALSLAVFVRISRRAGKKQTVRTSQVITLLSDTLSNIKPLKAMGQQKVFINHMERRILKLRNSVRTQNFSRLGMRYGKEILSVAAAAGGFYFAAVVWKFPLPELIISGLIFRKILIQVTSIQQLLLSSVQAESAYWAVQDMIEKAKENKEPKHGSKVPTLVRGCRFENVSFGYRDTPVLDGASLEIPANKISVLHGPSGVGKTTIADLAIGLHRPDSGQVLLDDVPLTDIDIEKWRHMIGYVPQEPTLFHDSISANITLGDPTIGESEIWEALEQAGTADFVRGLPEGLETTVGERGAKISGGQKQRIALARALVTKPALLILDEVTSALDEKTERNICNNIRKLTANGYTVLAITHRPAWTEIADRLYLIENGKIRLAKKNQPDVVRA